MSGLFLNSLVSAVVGVLAAVGTTWYVSAQSGSNDRAASENSANKIKRLEVESLVISDSLLLVDQTTREPLVEIRDGKIFAQKGLYADHIGAMRVTASKLQTTPEDPLDPRCAVFGELAVNEDGGGYLAIMNPQESHSLTLGFARDEKACVVSQNTMDASVAAQAVFPKPTRDSRVASGAQNASRSGQVRAADVRAAGNERILR